MAGYSQAIQTLIAELGKLPGIGARSAERLAFHLLKSSRDEALALADAIGNVKQLVRPCKECFNLAEDSTCPICSDARRDPGLLCVVEEPSDLMTLERTGAYRGLYHVLGGALSPLKDVGPDDLHIRELLKRIRAGEFREVILHRRLVKGCGLALDHFEGALGTMTETGAEPIAVHIADEAGLAVDDGDCPFCARGHTVSATIAELFVDFDHFTYSHDSLLDLFSQHRENHTSWAGRV